MKEITAWMVRDVITIDPDKTVLEACLLMQKNNIGAAIVTKDNKPIGIFTERDLLNKIIVCGKAPQELLISEVMTKEVKTATTTSSYKEVYDLMRLNNIRHLPILEDGVLVGVVSIRDLLRFHMRSLEQTITELTNEIIFVRSLLDKSNDDRTRDLYQENKRLQDMAIVDSLTGLYNYRYFEEIFSKEIARAKRYNHVLTLLFIDIDFFKHYNDLNGHEQGNIVLRELAGIMRRTSRQTDTLCKLHGVDIVARYGGEEFVVVLPETPKQGGVVRANRLLEDVRKYPFKNKESQPSGKLTVSIGIAEYPTDATIWEEVIKKADAALYQAKNTGRDKLVYT